jgi:uncharacterized RDD family membrane protein YckC
MGSFQYQGIAKRLAAQIIDLVILYSVFSLILVVMLTGLSFESFALKLSGMTMIYVIGSYVLVFSLIFFLYFIVLESFTGMTVGKRAMRIKVVREDGSKCGLMPAVVRNLLRIVDVLPFLYILGMIVIARSDKKQRVGDVVARTILVSLESATQPISPQSVPSGEKKFCAYCGTELYQGAAFCGNCGAKQ